MLQFVFIIEEDAKYVLFDGDVYYQLPNSDEMIVIDKEWLYEGIVPEPGLKFYLKGYFVTDVKDEMQGTFDYTGYKFASGVTNVQDCFSVENVSISNEYFNFTKEQAIAIMFELPEVELKTINELEFVYTEDLEPTIDELAFGNIVPTYYDYTTGKGIILPAENYKLENFTPGIIVFGFSFITLFTSCKPS
mgnify:CR=1 FL=1